MWENFFYDMQNAGQAHDFRVHLDMCSGHIIIGITIYGWSIIAGSTLTAFISYTLMWVDVHCNQNMICSLVADDDNDITATPSSVTNGSSNQANNIVDRTNVNKNQHPYSVIQYLVCCDCIATDSDLIFSSTLNTMDCH